MAITKHFALRDNETDLLTKEGIQETFVNVLGMLSGKCVFVRFCVCVSHVYTHSVCHIFAKHFPKQLFQKQKQEKKLK